MSRLRGFREISSLFGLLALLTNCSNSPAFDDPVAPSKATTESVLLPESTLTSSCFDWPASEFTLASHADQRIFVHDGDSAIDFTLGDVDDVSYRLSQLLRSKPVLLVFGSYT